jgi:hypothetical protein
MKPNYSFQKRQKELEKKKKKAEKLAKKAAGGDQTPDDPTTDGDEAEGDSIADEASGADQQLSAEQGAVNAVPSDSNPLKP